MRLSPDQQRLDIILSLILSLLLFLSFLYRSSPVDFMNPGFPILRGADLRISENFLPLDSLSPKRLTNVYDSSKVRYEIDFHLIPELPVGSGYSTTPAYHGFQTLTRHTNKNEANAALKSAYQEYLEYEGGFPIPISDVPLKNFVSQADTYLLWCAQYSHEPIFDAEKVETCYYWAVYDSYFSEFRLFVEGEKLYPLDLFTEIITRAENKIRSKVNTQR